MIIRQEDVNDYKEVYELVKSAFASAEISDGTEQDLVEALRKNKEAYIPDLSLIAEEQGELIGHIMFTKIKIGSDVALALAPLSVKPKYQRQGVGMELIKQGHIIAERLGYSYVVVLGSDSYYPKLGYRQAKEFSIEVPEGIPSENYMAIKLMPGAKVVSGKVVYAPEFGI